MNRRIVCILALLLTAALLMIRMPMSNSTGLPGADTPQRTLINVWTLSSIGGGQAWLKQALKRYERAHPGVMTYLRQATPEDLTEESAVLPDLLLYMPGDLTDVHYFKQLTGVLPIEDALLACGQYGGVQYGLPLCWGAYVMAIDSRLEPGSAITPAPTTLLGKPAPTDQAPHATCTPGYPLQAASAQVEPLQCAAGVPCLTLRMLLPDSLPQLPANLSDQTQVYTRYLAGQCATAVLTTGQATALESAILNGKAPACRIMTPQSIVTDQVWLGSITQHASNTAVDLLAWLVSQEAQALLTAQQLQPVRAHTRLYADGWPAEIANAAQHSLTIVNAYQPKALSQQLGHQVLHAQLSVDDAARQLCMDKAANNR